MSKFLKAFKRIKTATFIKCETCDEKCHRGCLCCLRKLTNAKELDIIEKGLKQLEEYKKLGEENNKYLSAIKGIEQRLVFDSKGKSYFVNKLIYWGDDLMLCGYDDDSNFKVADYKKTFWLRKDKSE